MHGLDIHTNEVYDVMKSRTDSKTVFILKLSAERGRTLEAAVNELIKTGKIVDFYAEEREPTINDQGQCRILSLVKEQKKNKTYLTGTLEKITRPVSSRSESK